MEQEAEYLAALASAATYNVEGNLLEMRTADDQLAVMMTRKFEVDLPEPDPFAPWGRVTAPAGMNVRSGPGVNFPVVGSGRLQRRGGDRGTQRGQSLVGRQLRPCPMVSAGCRLTS